MEKTYKIEEFDNGWSLEDTDSATSMVVEEKRGDIRHERFKQKLGGWLCEDIKEAFDEIEDVRCVIEIKFRKDGKVCDDKA